MPVLTLDEAQQIIDFPKRFYEEVMRLAGDGHYDATVVIQALANLDACIEVNKHPGVYKISKPIEAPHAR